MPRRVATNRGSFVRGPRRQTRWVGSTVALTQFGTIPAASKVLFGQETAAALEAIGVPLTLVRTRGQFSYKSDQQVANEEQIGAVGLAIVSETARGAGAASIPGPQTDSDWDGWFYWSPLYASFSLASAVGFAFDEAHTTVVDSKAMRKINDDEAVVFMVENNHATHGFEFALNIRSLYKMH